MPNVGEQLPDSSIYLRTYYATFVKDSIFVYKLSCNGWLFYLEAFKNKEIVNVFTGDTNFTTPEGIRVGDNGVKVKQLGILKGDESRRCEYELPSKWKAVLRKTDTLKLGSIFTFGNDPEKMKIITIRKYKE